MDENNGNDGSNGDAPAGDGNGAADAQDDSVTLTAAQLKSIENSIWSKARKVYAKNGAPPDPHHEARVQRGLKLLETYEHSSQQIAEADARIAPLQERALAGLSARDGKGGRAAAASQPAQQQQQPSRLEQMFEKFMEMQLVEKMPKAPISYATQGDQIRGELNAAIADIPEDDPRRHERTQKAILDKLKGVRITPAGKHNPPTKK